MKHCKRLVACLLCFALLLSASSCDLVERVKGLFDEDKTEGPKEPERVVVEVPEGYTGGSRYAQPEYHEIYWFETVAEAKDAISRLEAHGSTVYKSALLDYSSENYDVKVMLKIDRTYVEPLKDGQNPFDRKAGEVYIRWFLFDEYISIDELVYMSAEDICKVYGLTLSVKGDECKIENPELLTIDHGLPEFGLDWPENAAPPNKYIAYYDGEFIFSADINGEKGLLPKDIAKEMLKTATVVGNTAASKAPLLNYGDRYYSFETYDELISALETLKAHGSTLRCPTYVFDCEGVMFNNTPLDCKYIITFNSHRAEPLKEGQNPFERKIEGIGVYWEAFDSFNCVYDNEGYPIFAGGWHKVFNNFSHEGELYGVREIEDDELLTIYYDFPDWTLDISFTGQPVCYAISYDGDHIWDVRIYEGMANDHDLSDYPPPEFALEFVKTIRYIH